MILCLSSSSSLASAALFSEDGELHRQESREAPRNASTALVEIALPWLKSGPVKRILADVGPGSFTGSKVAVVLAKTWAHALGLPAGAVAAFDLIAGAGPKAVPSRKGEFFLWDGAQVSVVSELPADAILERPHAANLAPGQAIEWGDAMRLLPNYIHPPSISQPKRPPSLLLP